MPSIDKATVIFYYILMNGRMVKNKYKFIIS
jgi:hypothetical protein